MINNKSQLKKALKERAESLTIKRLYNYEKDNKIKEGTKAKVEHVQTNAFTIKYDNFDRVVWIYFDNVEVKDNKIVYYNFVPSHKKEIAESMNIDLIPLDQDEYIKINKGSNQEYKYKYIYIINEILESGL